jgi:hypothetical protein
MGALIPKTRSAILTFKNCFIGLFSVSCQFVVP